MSDLYTINAEQRRLETLKALFGAAGYPIQQKDGKHLISIEGALAALDKAADVIGELEKRDMLRITSADLSRPNISIIVPQASPAEV